METVTQVTWETVRDVLTARFDIDVRPDTGNGVVGWSDGPSVANAAKELVRARIPLEPPPPGNPAQKVQVFAAAVLRPGGDLLIFGRELSLRTGILSWLRDPSPMLTGTVTRIIGADFPARGLEPDDDAEDRAVQAVAAQLPFTQFTSQRDLEKLGAIVGALGGTAVILNAAARARPRPTRTVTTTL
jgi:hypothetical protein